MKYVSPLPKSVMAIYHHDPLAQNTPPIVATLTQTHADCSRGTVRRWRSLFGYALVCTQCGRIVHGPNPGQLLEEQAN